MLMLLLLSRAFAADPAPTGEPSPAEPQPTADAPATDAPPADAPPADAPPADAPPADAPPAEPPAGAPEPAPPTLSLDQLQGQATDPPPPPLQTGQISGDAEDARVIDKKFFQFLKPSPFHLPQNPRGQVDFTAYTLEWGEVKLGVVNLTIGVLPHIQVGTSVPLDVLGIFNVQAKAHITEGGPFDIGPYVNYYVFPREAVNARYLEAGGAMSIRLLEPWSLHIGGGWTKGYVEGELDISDIAELITGEGLDGAPVLGARADGEAVTARIATDVRLNRRDSIILQAEAILWGKSTTTAPDAVLDFLDIDDALSYNGFVPITEAAAASIAWHFAWKHLEARVGVGVSSVPGAWLLQSTELSYRFGGPTRVRERKLREGWKDNRDELKKARKELRKEKKQGKTDEPPAPTPPEPPAAP